MLARLLQSLRSHDVAAPQPAAGADPAWATSLREIDRRLQELSAIAGPQLQSLVTQERDRLLADSRYDDPLRLERHGASVYSQNDEDGILAEIFRRIGTTDRRFLEFGVDAGLENNTLCLIEQGWSGAWIEGDAARVAQIHKGFGRWLDSGRLVLRHALVMRENINGLIGDLKLPPEPDLISIDIDGNDYHVWEAIDVIRPRVVAIEYNAKFPPPMEWIMAYDPMHGWDGTDQFGASLESLTTLAARKDYTLVGCSLSGANAFFVRTPLAAGKFAQPATAASLYHPPRYHLVHAYATGHPPGYSRSQMR
ncbi:MAG: hypothetical protein JNM79_07080 [Burkholderiales bacterium]|nr:hypothetical protein [Burkholderiales bacterium]